MSVGKEWLAVLEWLKKPTFALSSLIALGTLLIWADALAWLGLDKHRWIIAALCIFAACVLAAQLFGNGWTVLQGFRLKRVIEKKCRNRLHQLTGDEKAILKRYVDGQTRTQNLNLTSGIVAGLESAGVIYRASNVGMGTTYSYNITDFAWDYLNEHPDLLADLDGRKAEKRRPKP